MNQPDALGCLRRALTSHTNKERLNHDAATEYLKLPVQVRMATIAETELKDLMMQQVALSYSLLLWPSCDVLVTQL